jgi:hypothetical protein
MNTLKIIGSLALIVIALWVCVRWRRVFLIQCGPGLALRLLAGLLCLALLGLATWAGFYLVSISTGWAFNAIYTFSLILVLTCYVHEVITFKDLPKEWKRSPLFILALFPPVLGWVLMTMVWWHEVGRRQYIDVKAQV